MIKNISWTIREGFQATSAHWATALHADTVVPFAAIPDNADGNGYLHVIEGLWGGYDIAPLATGFIEIIGGSDGLTVIGKAPIAACGLFFVDVLRKGFRGQAMKAVLTDGGAGITGYLNVNYRLETCP